MKKLVRLTEQDLHNIIKESVNKLLNELDWRTYHSAAMKDYNKKRAQKFADMRNKLFNDEYGYDDHKKGNHIGMVGDYNNPHLDMLVNNNNKDRIHYIKRPDEKHYGWYQDYSSGYVHHPFADDDKRLARKMTKAHDAFKGINNKYENGKYIDDEEPTDFHTFLGKK